MTKHSLCLTDSQLTFHATVACRNPCTFPFTRSCITGTRSRKRKSSFQDHLIRTISRLIKFFDRKYVLNSRKTKFLFEYQTHSSQTLRRVNHECMNFSIDKIYPEIPSIEISSAKDKRLGRARITSRKQGKLVPWRETGVCLRDASTHLSRCR